MAISICRAGEQHLAQLEALEEKCFSLPWTGEQLSAQMTAPNCVFLVAANDEGRVLAYVGLSCVLDEGYINNIAVSPDFRRQGIAGLLLDALTKEAKSRELAFMTLEVREGNTPAIKLYEKHGFKAVGLRRDYYRKPTESAVLVTLFF